MEQFMKLLPVLFKGIGVAQVLASQGASIAPATRAIRTLLRKAESGPVSQADLDQTSSDLDSLMDRFNRPI
jgi:hypothetical protein